ncbi:hypothetical protein Tco_0094193 [Tanacetum coccineum]
MTPSDLCGDGDIEMVVADCGSVLVVVMVAGCGRYLFSPNYEVHVVSFSVFVIFEIQDEDESDKVSGFDREKWE